MGLWRKGYADMFLRNKWKILRGDKVQILAGKDKGNVGAVLKVIRDPKWPRVVVEGQNLVRAVGNSRVWPLGRANASRRCGGRATGDGQVETCHLPAQALPHALLRRLLQQLLQGSLSSRLTRTPTPPPEQAAPEAHQGQPGRHCGG